MGTADCLRLPSHHKQSGTVFAVCGSLYIKATPAHRVHLLFREVFCRKRGYFSTGTAAKTVVQHYIPVFNW